MTLNTTLTFVTVPTFKPHIPYLDFYWIACEIVLILITFVIAYLLVCLIHFATVTKFKPSREVSGSKKGKLLYQMCLLSVIMSIGRLTSDQVVAFLGWRADLTCSVSVAISAVFYSLSLYPVYIFLWLRQSIFYASPVLSHVLNPVITAASWLTLFFMIFGGAAITVFYVVPDINGWNYIASPTGCRDISDQSGFELVPTILVCFTVMFQGSLLGLFVYPLFSKKTQRYRKSLKGEHCQKHEAPNSNASEAHDEDVSNPCCSSDSAEQKCISDINFESNNGSYISSVNADVSQGIVSYKNSNGKAINSVSGEAKMNTLNKNNKAKKKEKFPDSKRISSLPFYFDFMKRNRSISVNSSSEGYKSKKFRKNKTQQGRRVIRFIRKAFLLALICVISDVVFTVTQLMIVVPELVYLVLFDINLLINIICIIVSFREWETMILPVCSRKAARASRPPVNSNESFDVINQRVQSSQPTNVTPLHKSNTTNQISSIDHEASNSIELFVATSENL